MFVAAVVQLTSTSDAEANLKSAEALVRRAASHGAKLICTPENTNYLGPHQEKVRLAEPLSGPTVSRLRELAASTGSHLLIGSINERSDMADRCFNTSVLLGPTGDILAKYRKIHLFDVDVSAEVRFRESDTIVPGDKVVVAETPLGRIGLSICYDLRFPELYAKLVAKGAQLISIPAAFTLHTGKDHWHPLVRARAIETQSYVLAAGQCGTHDDGGLRNSYGHSMIVDPWGHVTAMASDGPTIAMAEIDLDRIDVVRNAIPVCSHRCL